MADLRTNVTAVNSLLDDYEEAKKKGNTMSATEWIDGMMEFYEISEEVKLMFIECVDGTDEDW